MGAAASMARTIWHAYRIGANDEDVAQLMLLGLVNGTRRYYWHHAKTYPPSWFVWVVLRRRRFHIIRSIRNRTKLEGNMPMWETDGEFVPVDIEDDAPRPDEVVVQADDEALYAALTFALNRNVPPAVFALLHLRFVEELTPMEIAELTGNPGPDGRRLASGRLKRAKDTARDFLRSLGIATMEQANRLSLGDFDHDDFD
tara:strand:- start:389 stop:988 length:600 start_codon:yes stop_codon:yes gene_type:complete